MGARFRREPESVINADVLDRRDEHARQFREALPFRHVVIDGFLDPALCQRILDDFPGFEERYARNEMGDVGGKAVRMDVRDISDAYRGLDRFLQTPEFLGYVSAVTGIPDLLYDADYIGGGTHENRDGQGLDAHVDFNYHPRTKTHRRLNLIVYLNHEWDERWGGALELHSDPWNPAADRIGRVLPLFNRAVIFETNEVSWHGFSRIDLPADRKRVSRKSFAIYLYTKQRPPQETAPPHATIYVPDALPAGLAAGKPLTAAELSELTVRFTRLRTQLRYLYDREKGFGAQIAALEYALAEARAALRAPLQGYALQLRAATGLFDDLWVGREFVLPLLPQRAVRGIEIDLWVPEQIDGEQFLEIESGGRRWEHRIARGAHSRAAVTISAPAGRELELRVAAGSTFVPARAGGSGDQRELAWRLLAVKLLH